MLTRAINNLNPFTADALKDLWNEPGAWMPPGMMRIGWEKNPITGKQLTEEDVYYCSIAWRCMILVGGTVSSLPRFLYRSLPNGGYEKATSHPNYYVISVAPNDEQTWAQYDYMRVLRYFMYGNSYDQKLINRRGDVVALNPLHPSRMEVTRHPSDDRLIYKYTDRKGVEHELEKWEVHHIAAPSTEGIVGISTCAVAQRAIQLCRDFDEFTERYLHNDATPPYYFITDKTVDIKKKDEIYDDIVKKNGGLKNKHRAGGILDMGLKPFLMNLMTNKDAEMDAQRRRNESTICRYFGVQEHKVGLLDRSTNNNIETQGDEYREDTASPILTIFQQAKERDFLKRPERKYFIVEYDVDQLEWANQAKKHESQRADVTAGILAPNEARAERNLKPHEDEIGNALLIPTSHAPNGKIIAAPEPEAAEKPKKEEKKPVDKKDAAAVADGIFAAASEESLIELKALMLPAFEDAASRCHSREIEAFESTMKRVHSGKPAAEGWTYMKTFYKGHLEAIRNAFRVPVSTCAKLMLAGPKIDQELFLIQLANRMVEKSLEDLHKIAANDFKETMLLKSSELVARTELDELFKLAGVVS